MSFAQRELEKVRAWPMWLKVVTATLCFVVGFNTIGTAVGTDIKGTQELADSDQGETRSPSEMERDAVNTWSMQVAGRVAECQRRIRGFAPAFEDVIANAQRGFEEATRAALVCRAVTAGMASADKPDMVGRDVIRHMLLVEDDCRRVTRLSQDGAEAAARLFDGSYRPSTISEIRKNIDQANNQSDKCLSGLNDVRQRVGMKRLD